LRRILRIAHMRPTATDVARSVVCLSVSGWLAWPRCAVSKTCRDSITGRDTGRAALF